jgi:prepilin-type N-terminal cleavage/methylation domain-containing protein
VHVSRARSQDGFTVVEMLVAAVILSIVATGAMKFVDVLLKQSRGVVERTDAMQRGRLALDQMTRSLRSQVCLNENTEGLKSGKSDEVQFYADYGTGVNPPQLRTLRYDAAKQSLIETTIQGEGSMTNPSFPTSKQRTKVLLDGVTKDGSTPVFQYRAFNTSTPREANVPLTAPLSPTDLGVAALVKVTFQAGGFHDAEHTTRLQDDVLLRNTDPNAARPDPTCR